MKRKFRILKLKPFTYIVQIQDSKTGEWLGYGGIRRLEFSWEEEKYQMEFCRKFTLIGARLAIPKDHASSKRKAAEKKRADKLRDLFRKGRVVYEVEVNE